MSSKCVSCGGSLVYDIAAEKLKCLYCDSLYEVETSSENAGAEEYETSVFTCPNCGGEIAANSLQAVDYCVFCGSFVTLDSQMARIRRPETIVPFKKTMEDCKKIYRRKLAVGLYAPKEFRNEQFLEGFKGIYIPYWDYHYTIGPEGMIRGEVKKEQGSYIYTTKMAADCRLSGGAEKVMFDASSTLDDELGAEIAPFSTENRKPFHPGYLYGFYGDTADIEADVYHELIGDEIEDRIWDKLRGDHRLKAVQPEAAKPKNFGQDIHLEKTTSMSLMPVWFLTWKKGDRVAYSLMNGETGKLYAEVPIDIKRYLLMSLITAIPIFFWLNMSVTFTAAGVLWMSILISFFMIMFYVFQLDRIVRRVMHTDDIGYLSVHKEAKRASDEKVTENIITMCVGFVVNFAKDCGIFFTIIGLVLLLGVFEYLAIGLILLIFGLPIYTFVRIGKDAKILNDKTVWWDISGAIFAIVLSAFLLIMDPAGDIFYYVLASICMLGVAYAAIRMMKRYNELITRPVPYFYDRKGAEKL